MTVVVGRGGPRTVDVHIRRLRARLTERPVVTTVRGVGYRLADDANLRVVRVPAPADRVHATCSPASARAVIAVGDTRASGSLSAHGDVDPTSPWADRYGLKAADCPQ